MRKFKHGFLGKISYYEEFKDVPPTTEERRKELLEKMKPWEFDPKRPVFIGGKPGGKPVPSPTPTPSITPTQTITPTPSITPSATLTPTPTITPSPSVLITYYLLTAEGDELQTAELDNLLWTI